MRSYIGSFFDTEKKEEKSHDVFRDHYEGITTQRAYVADKIKAFQNINQAFTSTCKSLSAIGGCAFLLSAWGMVPAALIFGGYYFLGDFKNPCDIKTQSFEFQEKLKELLKIYQWMTKKVPVISTNDSLTIQVLKNIAPYIVQTDDLIPEHFIQRAKDINPNFFMALENTSHELSARTIQLIYDEKCDVKENHAPPATTWERYTSRLRSTPCRHLREGMSQIFFGYDSKTEKKADWQTVPEIKTSRFLT